LRKSDSSLGACFRIIITDRTILTAKSHKSRHDRTWERPGKQKSAFTHADVWSIFAEIYKLGVR
jgi:hypothetical protein